MGEGVDICMLKEYLEKNYGYNVNVKSLALS